MRKKEYYEIPISKKIFWFWLIIVIIFILLSKGSLFFLLFIPIIVLLQLSNTMYSYNDIELIIKKGLIFKVQRNIALNKIEEVNVKLGLLNLIIQAKPASLMNIKNLKEESNKFINVWNKTKTLT